MKGVLIKDGAVVIENGGVRIGEQGEECCCDDCISCLTLMHKELGPAVCQSQESLIYASDIRIIPEPACGEVTIEFDIYNGTGSLWEARDAFTTQIYLYISGRTINGTADITPCLELIYDEAAPAPYTATTDANGFIRVEWEDDIAAGATKTYSVKLTFGEECNCEDDDVIRVEASAERGCRSFALLCPECCACTNAMALTLTNKDCDATEGITVIEATEAFQGSCGELTLSFTIRNDSGATWTGSGINDTEAYVTWGLSDSPGEPPCLELELTSASPTPTVFVDKTNYTAGDVYRVHWDFTLAPGATKTFEVTYSFGDADCSCLDEEYEAQFGVARGCDRAEWFFNIGCCGDDGATVSPLRVSAPPDPEPPSKSISIQNLNSEEFHFSKSSIDTQGKFTIDLSSSFEGEIKFSSDPLNVQILNLSQYESRFFSGEAVVIPVAVGDTIRLAGIAESDKLTIVLNDTVLVIE